MVMTYHRDWTPAKKKRVAERIARKKGVIGGKGSREQAKTEIEGREGRIGGTMSVRRKVIIETIARSKTRKNLRVKEKAHWEIQRDEWMRKPPLGSLTERRRKVAPRKNPKKRTTPSLRVMRDRPPRKVGVGREQAKIEPAGLSAKISAIVNSIMRMIFGK